MTNDLVDFHCHLDLYPDHAAAVAACERAGVDTLAVTTTPRSWPRNRDLCASTQHVRAALGLHPQLVAERAQEISIWEECLPEARFVGEVGLDAGPRFYRSLERQKRVFEHVLRCCAQAGGKILSVHSVRAAAAVLDLVEAHLPADRGRVVLHWFTGSPAEARRAVDLGCYFSVNAAMLNSARGSGLLVKLPADRLLTETDGPFTRSGERPTRPTDVAAVVEMMARLLRSDRESVARTIRGNLRKLLSLFDSGDSAG